MQVWISSASLCVLLNQLNGDEGALFLPEAGHAFLIVAILQCLCLPVLQQPKIIPSQNVSCLSTTENHSRVTCYYYN